MRGTLTTASSFAMPGRESAKMTHFLLDALGAAGIDERRLARDARIPDRVLRDKDAMTSPRRRLAADSS
jgi:hypothetical protein